MSNSIKLHIPDDLIKDFQKYGNNIAKNIATQVRDALTEEYMYSIEKFYGAYDPQKYKRQYSLYETGKKFYRNPHGTRFHGGVEIYSDDMGKHSQPNDYVLDISLMGIHGEPQIAITPPWILQHMLTYQHILYDSIEVDDGGIGSNAIAKAKTGSYSILKF